MSNSEQSSDQERTSFYEASRYADLLSEARSGRSARQLTDIARDLPVRVDRDPDKARAQANEAATKYMEQFPDQLQAIAVISEIGSVIRTQDKLQRHERMSPRELEDAFRDLTEYQFLITNFALHNIDNMEAMREMWSALFKVSEKMGGAETVAKLKTGVLSTVATMKCLEAMGAKPALSHPDDDAFRAIDINLAGTRAVQVKRGYETDDRILFTTDEADFPGAEFQNEDGSINHVSA